MMFSAKRMTNYLFMFVIVIWCSPSLSDEPILMDKIIDNCTGKIDDQERYNSKGLPLMVAKEACKLGLQMSLGAGGDKTMLVEILNQCDEHFRSYLDRINSFAAGRRIPDLDGMLHVTHLQQRYCRSGVSLTFFELRNAIKRYPLSIK